MKNTQRFGALLLALLLTLVLAGCGARTPEAPAAPPQGESTELPAQGGAAPVSPDEVPQAPDSSAVSAPPESGAETEVSDGAGAEERPASGGTPNDEPESPAARTCTLSISCAALLKRMDVLTPEKAELVPADGLLLPALEWSFEEGESVFDLLKRVCREKKLHMEFSETPLYGSAYIEGIGNLYEFDGGEGSGWMYRVNGAFPQVGCSQYALCAGDRIEWVYTCDFGADVGGGTGE